MNELKINIPEGYIIDKENTNLEEGIIKFKKNEISWNKIANHFDLRTVINVDYGHSDYFISYKKLFYIAKYLNKGWKPESGKLCDTYVILKRNNDFCIYNTCNYAGTIYFKSKEDAELAIKLMGDDLKYLF